MSNIYVSQLPDLEFFQGDTVTIPFRFVNGLNEPIDLSSTTVYWRLCPYGNYNEPILILNSIDDGSAGEKNIVIDGTDTSVCYVNLTTDMTKNLTYIKYTQQPVISLIKPGPRYEEYIRAEGNIIFKPRTKTFEEIS